MLLHERETAYSVEEQALFDAVAAFIREQGYDLIPVGDKNTFVVIEGDNITVTQLGVMGPPSVFQVEGYKIVDKEYGANKPMYLMAFRTYLQWVAESNAWGEDYLRSRT
jgi:hypothetical protein